MRRSKYDAATLAPIVASSHSLAEVIRTLGLRPTGGNHRFISARVRQAGLDTSHFGWGRLRASVEAVSVDALTELVEQSTSFGQVLTKLNLPTKGRAHHELKKRVRALGIATTHFTGPGWSRGQTALTHPSVARITRAQTRPDDEVFIANSPEIRGPAIARRLVAKGWSYRCAVCGIAEWQEKSLVLHLDHINGIHNDNRYVNLRFLCPNCHSQTDTYCNRARGKASRASEPRGHYTCYIRLPHASVLELVDNQRLERCGR